MTSNPGETGLIFLSPEKETETLTTIDQGTEKLAERVKAAVKAGVREIKGVKIYGQNIREGD
jgi:hypothetical protein